MSKKTTQATPAQDITRLDAFTVREYQKDGATNSDWSRIGVAFPHQDGKGFRVVLQALPVDGVVILRTSEAKQA